MDKCKVGCPRKKFSNLKNIGIDHPKNAKKISKNPWNGNSKNPENIKNPGNKKNPGNIKNPGNSKNLGNSILSQQM